MKFLKQSLKDVLVIEPEPFSDHRGMFRRMFCEREFEAQGAAFNVRQSNLSENKFKGTLRGFHYQHTPYQEGKIMTCIRGALYDIVVDLRTDSPTYMKWIAVDLTADNRRSLYVPPGCANAWMTMQDDTWALYYSSEFYVQKAEGGIRYNDPAFNFKWPMDPVVISDKDKNSPLFAAEKKKIVKA